MVTILISGSSGYIGKYLAAAARKSGHSVTEPAAMSNAGVWRLGADPPRAMFEGVDAVVHLAHSWRNENGPGMAENINIAGSEMLALAALGAGVGRFIFVSTVSARPQAPNQYGRVKHATEARLLALSQAGAVVCARVGLVYGGEAAGQYGVMRKLARMTPILPVPGFRQVQPIHINEVCEGLLELAAGPPPVRPIYVLAAPRPMSFGNWLRLLRQGQTGSDSMLLIPLPLKLILLASRILSAIPFVPKIDRERILGLAGTGFCESAPDLKSLQLRVRDPATWLLSPRLANRQLLREANILLRYLLAQRPPRKLVVRLVRALQSHDETALKFSRLVRCQPRLLRLLDSRGGNAALGRHLQLAMMILESAPDRYRPKPANVFIEILCEMAALPIRLIARHIPR